MSSVVRRRVAARYVEQPPALASFSVVATIQNVSVAQGGFVDVTYLVDRAGFLGTITLTANNAPPDVAISYPSGQLYTGTIDALRVRYAATVGAALVSLFDVSVTLSATGATSVVKNGTVSVTSAALFDTVAELPRSTPTFDMAASRAYTGGDLHQPMTGPELNTVLSGGTLAGKTLKRGDRIELAAGNVYSGSALTFTLPALSGTPDPNDMSTFVHFRGAPVATLPMLGYRTDASDKATVGVLRCAGTGAGARIVRAALNAKGWVLDTVAWDGGSSTSCAGYVELGNYSTATSASQYCSWMVVNQCIGTSTFANQAIRNLAVSGTNIVIRDGHFANGGYSGGDDQAINIQTGVGPYLVTNNFIQAGAEGFMSGGVNAGIYNQNPQDITFTRNHVYRPWSWNTAGGSHDGNVRQLKNLFELKFGARVLVEGNVFENYWPASGQKFALKMKSTSNGSADPTQEVSNVTVRYNYLKNCCSFFDAYDRDSAFPLVLANRFSIHDNLVDGIGNPAQPEAMTTVCSIRASFVWVFDNTMIPHASASGYALLYGDPSVYGPFTDMLFQNNIGPRLSNGYRNGNLAEGVVALTRWPSCIANYNTLIGNPNLAVYPANTYKTASVATAGFVNAAAGNYRLSGSSPLLGTGLGGTDPGADIDLVEAAIAGTISGVWP